MRFRNGTPFIRRSALTVTLVVERAPITFRGDALTLSTTTETAPSTSAHVHHDANGDGLFGPGDQVMLRDIVSNPVYDSLTVEVLNTFGGILCIDLGSDVGVDSPRSLSFTTAEVE